MCTNLNSNDLHFQKEKVILFLRVKAGVLLQLLMFPVLPSGGFIALAAAPSAAAWGHRQMDVGTAYLSPWDGTSQHSCCC